MRESSVVALMTIGHVWRLLGGPPIRRGRGQGFPRGSRDFNISIDEQRNVWKDHATGAGGGILDLVVWARGGSLAEAAAWLEEQLEVDEIPLWNRTPTAVYRYTNEDGNLLGEKCRYEPGLKGRKKDFLQRHYDASGRLVYRQWSRPVLYHLPEIIEAPIIFLVAGEKDVETLRQHGFCGTTSPGGENSRWRPEYTETLRGKEIILIPDNDGPGRRHAAKVARALFGSVAKLTILTLEGEGIKDATDWFAAGHSELELIAQLDPEGVAQ